MGSTNVQLECMIKMLGIRNYIGYFMKNELKNEPVHKNECLLINLESSNQIGTHHTALWKKGRDIRYFDSFGSEIPPQIREHYKGYKIFNFQSFDGNIPEKPIQKYSQSICGELAVTFLLLCQKGYSYLDIIQLLENVTK